MAYLPNDVVTLDAILTKKGRELLAHSAAAGLAAGASGSGFQITQFALSDDEIDYTLYNPNHPSGSAYYGEAIENMPLLEAFPDENQIMKYKLASLPRGTAVLPTITLGYSAITLTQGDTFKSISPTTIVGDTNKPDTSFTFTVSDARVFSSFTTTGGGAVNSTTKNIGTSISQTAVGQFLSVTATGVSTLFGVNDALYATLIIVGRQTGARLQVPITITKTST